MYDFDRWFCAFLFCVVLLFPRGGALAEPAERRCYEDTYCILVEQHADSLHFSIENLLPIDITIRFEAELQNLDPTLAFPYTASFPAEQQVEAFSLVIKEGSWRYQYRNTWAYGALGAEHDDSYIYALPYLPNESYRVTQASFGTFSHQETHAVDFGMPEDTPVVAAREGVVVAIQEDYNEAGLEEHFKRMANYVLILHDDGTLARYAHLREDGVKVLIGQHVQQGQVIGFSGHTGYSKGPHLHFEVYTVTPTLKKQTVPVRFRVGRRKAALLRAGRAYRSIDG